MKIALWVRIILSMVAKIDSKWVIVFNSDLGQKDENGYQAIYYEISPECGKVFEKSDIWKY